MRSRMRLSWDRAVLPWRHVLKHEKSPPADEGDDFDFVAVLEGVGVLFGAEEAAVEFDGDGGGGEVGWLEEVEEGRGGGEGAVLSVDFDGHGGIFGGEWGVVYGSEEGLNHEGPRREEVGSTE